MDALAVTTEFVAFREGSLKVTLTIVKLRYCAWHEATGWQGRVYMRALPVWKLSVDSQQPKRVLLTVTTECDHLPGLGFLASG